MFRTGGKAQALTSPIASRLVAHINAAMLRATWIPRRDTQMFSINGGENGVYVANRLRWLPSIDFTSSPVWNSREASPGTWGRGCLVTPIHTLFAAHFGHAVGRPIVWCGADGQLYSRTPVAIDLSLVDADVGIARLNSPLPSAVTPAKLLPANADQWISPADLASQISTVVINRDLRVLAKQWTGYTTANSGAEYLAIFNEDTLPLSRLTGTLVGGDSGAANYLIVRNEAVLLTTNHFATSGPALHLLRSAIDSVVAGMGGGFAIQSVDLSGFSV